MEKPEPVSTRRRLLGLGLSGVGLFALPACVKDQVKSALAPVPDATEAASVAPAIQPPILVADQPLHLKGHFVQSGYCIGQAQPNAELWVDGTMRGLVSDEGWFYAGFDRDAKTSCTVEVHGAKTETATVDIAPMTYDIQRVDGLPQDTVTPSDPALLARIKSEIALKNDAFASHSLSDHFKGGFIYPLDKFIVSGHFGNQRILNGTPSSPHMGFDMAAPIGTPIHAPQAGLVVLAEADLFYEGGLTLIDHGQGLISMYLHQSALHVVKGDAVGQGQLIGEVGAKGRATGPHLCWRLKWNERHMDPSLMVV